MLVIDKQIPIIYIHRNNISPLILSKKKEFVKQAKEFVEKQKQWKAFERKESKSPHFPGEKLQELKELFDGIALR